MVLLPAMRQARRKRVTRPAPKAGSTRLIIFNKPFQVLCQFTDSEGRATLADYIPVDGVYAAGRLDYDSEGLVALTDSGPLQHRLSDPAAKTPKTYLVQVEGVCTAEAVLKLRAGVQLKDGMTKPALVEVVGPPEWLWPRVPPIRFRKSVPESWLKVTITEGRNRQVRRMTAAVGHPTLRLVRVSLGPLELSDLKPGDWKQIPVPVELCSCTDR